MLQFSLAAHDFLYLDTHICFSVNEPNFHFKGNGRISTNDFNNIHLIILQLNSLSFQIKQFIIFQKFSRNSARPIWCVIINLTDITYSKIKYIIRNFLE